MKAGRLLAQALVMATSFVVVLLVVAFASRLYPTIWLPMTLAAVCAALLSLVPERAQVRSHLWVAIACGTLLMWMASEPGMHVRSDSRLRLLAMVLAALCMVVQVVMLLRAAAEADHRKMWLWAIAVALMSWLIAYFSSPRGGSSGMIDWAMATFGFSRPRAELAVLIFRKCLHFSFYGLLGFTGFGLAASLGAGLRRALAFGLLLVVAHAAFDEGRQTFFADRTGSAWDVLLDTSGAAVLAGSRAAVLRRRRLAT